MRETKYTKIVSVRLPKEMLDGLMVQAGGLWGRRILSKLIIQAIGEYLDNHKE